MVDEASHIATASGVDDGVGVDSKQVRTSDSNLGVLFLTEIRHTGTNLLANVLDDHFVGGNRLQRKQTPIVDDTFGKLELLLSELVTERQSVRR